MTQLAAHLESPVGKVIRGIVNKVLFLEQDASEFPAIAEAFNLTKDEQALFARVKKHPTWNSGYLRMSSGAGGIIRIFGDPVLHLLMTQEPAIRAEREDPARRPSGGRACRHPGVAAPERGDPRCMMPKPVLTLLVLGGCGLSGLGLHWLGAVRSAAGAAADRDCPWRKRPRTLPPGSTGAGAASG